MLTNVSVSVLVMASVMVIRTMVVLMLVVEKVTVLKTPAGTTVLVDVLV